jgi:DNA replication and repair protein RecF
VQLIKLRIFQYRNFDQDEIFPSAECNLFSGCNGQGKTNLLEAIYLLGYGKSFRTVTARDCIQHGKKECRVDGIVRDGLLEREVSVQISSTDKGLFLYGKPASLEEFVGNLHVIAFTPKHLDIVRGGPAERRAFLDRAMATIFPGHMRRLAAYGRALRQRNNLLAMRREGRGDFSEQMIESWDHALLQEGIGILVNRLRYFEEMNRELRANLFAEEDLKLRYLSNAAPEEMDLNEIGPHFKKRLLASRKRDEALGFTSIGPHRDDLELSIYGKSLADFGSSGQQRSCLLCLYFAQMEIHRKQHGFYPVFLFDDVEAELDAHRLRILMDYISGRTQCFLTSARKNSLCGMPTTIRQYEVVSGTVRLLDSLRQQ